LALVGEHDRGALERHVERIAGFHRSDGLLRHRFFGRGIYLEQDVDLAGEVEVEGALGDTGGSHNVFDRGRVVPCV
jgi:hypothetical protein